MKHLSRKLTACAIAAALLLVPMVQTAAAQSSYMLTGATEYAVEPSAESMVADGLVLRPAGIIGSAAGIAGWVITLPFSLLGQNVGQATEELIEKPVKYTFTRPLGSF